MALKLRSTLTAIVIEGNGKMGYFMEKGSVQKGFWTFGELNFTEDQLREATAAMTKKR
jgi:hypothetical protein